MNDFNDIKLNFNVYSIEGQYVMRTIIMDHDTQLQLVHLKYLYVMRTTGQDTTLGCMIMLIIIMRSDAMFNMQTRDEDMYKI